MASPHPHPIALALMLAACATTPTAEPLAPPPREPPPLTPAPPPPPLHPFPWVFGPWTEELVVDTTLAGVALVGPPRVNPEDGYRAHRTIDPTSLAPDLRAAIGQELSVLTRTAETCRLRLDGFEAVSAIDPERDDTTALYPEDEASDVSDSLFAQRLWDLGDKTLVARTTWTAPCDEPLVASLSPLAPAALGARTARPDERLAALRTVRDHGLWHALEAGYHESLRLARAHASRLEDAGHAISLPRKAPPHWDAPRDRDDPGPGVEVWSDSTGAARYQLVELGNELTCEAPRAWLLIDLADDRVARYGLDAPPLLALDIDADGAWELVRRSSTNVWIERLAPGTADAPEVLRAASRRLDEGAHCGWEQVPPLARMHEILARPAAP